MGKWWQHQPTQRGVSTVCIPPRPQRRHVTLHRDGYCAPGNNDATHAGARLHAAWLPPSNPCDSRVDTILRAGPNECETLVVVGGGRCGVPRRRQGGCRFQEQHGRRGAISGQCVCRLIMRACIIALSGDRDSRGPNHVRLSSSRAHLGNGTDVAACAMVSRGCHQDSLDRRPAAALLGSIVHGSSYCC